jgi:predicted phosphodiesterase
MVTRRHLLAKAAQTALAGGFLSSASAQEKPAPPAAAPAVKLPKDPYDDAELVDGEIPMPAEDSFCFAVLPDTQHYSEDHPLTFMAQTEWIVKERDRRRIAGVFHLGDLTNKSTVKEWENAQRAITVLEKGGVPFCLIPGNHDYSDGGKCTDRTTKMNDYFPVAAMKKLPPWGGNYDKEPDRLENNYQYISAGGRKFLILGLEFGPRADVLRWANEVAAAHKDHEIILLTHALIYHDDTRYDWKKYGKKQTWNPHDYAIAKATGDDVSDGEEIWQKLISKHENFIFTLNGHVLYDGLGRIATSTPGGRSIPQILVNFQMRPRGGDGWLRILEFKKDGSVQTYDYSPTRKQRNESVQNQFSVKVAAIA